MKISTRIVISEVLATAISMFAIIYYVSSKAKDIQDEAVHSELKQTAARYASDIDMVLEEPLDVARTLAQVFQGVDALPVKVRREYFSAQLKNILVDHPSYNSVWTYWEPDALDGMDVKFAGQDGYGSSGRYMSKWVRNNGNVKTIPIAGVEGELDLYDKLKQVGIEHVTSPYKVVQNGEEVYLTTLMVPIFLFGEFSGAVGIDVSVDFMREIVKEIKPYEEGYAFLVASDMSIAAHPNSDIQHKSIKEYITDSTAVKYERALKNGQLFAYEQVSPKTGVKSSYACNPIKIGKSNEVWILAVSVPDDIVFESSDRLSAIATVATIIALIILAFIAWFSGRIVEVNVKKVLREVDQLIKAGLGGRLEFRADPMNVHNDFVPIVKGMNEFVEAINKPIDVAATYITRISKGDLPDIIEEEYNGDFDKIKQSLNTLILKLNELTNEMNKLYKEQAQGDYEYFMDDTKFEGVFQQVAQGYNQAVKLHIDAILSMLDLVGQYGEGNFENEMPILPGKQVIATHTINGVRANLLNVVAEISKLTNEVQNGNLNAKADHTMHKGKYAEIIDGLNNTLYAVTLPLVQMIDSLQKLTSNIENGVLSSRLDFDNHKIAEFSMVSRGMNSALDALIQPLNIAEKYLVKVASGDMPEIIEDEYKGDFNNLKTSINTLITINEQVITWAQEIAEGNLRLDIEERSKNDELIIALKGMLKKLKSTVVLINDAADNVAAGSAEVSMSASMMAQSAHQQATSIEEVSVSIEEMEATVTQNAENANMAEQTVVKAAGDVEQGSRSVKTTVDAMRTIIEKIRIVTDIADKTDLLAINAAIEAARAGEHGEGFAVVAGEVRKLAEMSKEAAKEINMVSKSSLSVAEDSGNILASIVSQIQKAVQMVQEISEASAEQNSGIEQISVAVNQLNTLSQQNAATAEELSTGSEELSSQADMLKETMKHFQIEPTDVMSENKKKIQKPEQLGVNLHLDGKDDGYEKY